MVGFLRKHLFIVLGVALPLLLILFVFVAQQAARWGVPAPITPVLYLTDPHYSGSQFVRWTVREQHLKLSVVVPENAYLPPAAVDRPVRLALFDPRTDTLETIEVTLPEPLKPGLRADLALPPRLQAIRLSDAAESPDGYRFEQRSRRSGGLVGALFGLGGRRAGYQLVRDGVGYEVPPASGYVYHNNAFIGWVIHDEQSN
ncbi:hypothetical protein [Wenzhouxiangella marina]|uniref:Uncharacterized protein n=1 Tax=Wenzhouxiangella marina TaxID=1579979 RepID=A0A0K0XUE5_9GAMM|nr:hypothetical protein [Wenzhouxiangella marina]AKS41285.1 hypothetical protein WM2015_904 [Wenzhouxiangella marina]MBB6086965.1 hypothetical protein [Wenzhouxiangella marina]